MINFKRDENKVIVNVEHGIFRGKEYFALELNQTHEYQAELLRQAFQENLNRHLSRLKRKYYEDGWKEAKAKTKKRGYDDFFGGWEG